MGRKPKNNFDEKKRQDYGEGGLRWREDKQVWVYSRILGKKSNGKIVKVERSGKTQEEAKQRFYDALSKMNIEFELSEPAENGLSRDMSLGSFLIMYILKYKTGRRGKPLVSSSKSFYLFLTGLMEDIEDCPLRQLNANLLQNCLDRIPCKKKCGKKAEDEEYSERVMIRLCGFLKAALQFGVEEDVIPENYMFKVRRPDTSGAKSATNGRNMAIPIHVLRKLFDALCEDAVCKVIIHTLLYTGMRIGEVRAIQMCDWLPEQNSFVINKAVGYRYEFDENGHIMKTWTEFTATKTESSARLVTYDPALNPILQEWLRYCQQNKKMREHIATHEKKALLFPSRAGNIMDYKNLRERFVKLMEKVNLKEDELRFHRCRHTFATMLIDSEVDPKTVAELLGHSKVETTLNVYRTVSTATKVYASEKIGYALRDLGGGGQSTPPPPIEQPNCGQIADKAQIATNGSNNVLNFTPRPKNAEEAACIVN